MKKISFLLLLLLSLVCSGCFYSPIHGRVVDETTGKPLEGALVVAQWTKKHGFGLTYHDLYKITETLTDKDGKFSISGTYDPFVEPPEMIIYKEGYIPWRNDAVFPSCNIVKDHEWKNNVTYRLKVFSDEYTAEQVSKFINFGIIGLGHAPKYHVIHDEISNKAIDEFNTQKANQQKQ